jgi:hypothetical protein
VLRFLNETKSPNGKKESRTKEFIGDGAENLSLTPATDEDDCEVPVSFLLPILDRTVKLPLNR